MPAHILAVDDEANVRRIVQLLLTRAGYRVTLANDGFEAMARIAEERPDLIVLDVMMPHMDGFETLKRLKADPDLRDIRIVMLTARAQDEDIFEGERLGAEEYVTKPFTPQELLRAVEVALSLGAGE